MLILNSETQRAAVRRHDLVGRARRARRSIHAPKLKHRIVERHRKHAARQHFGRSDCKGQIKLLACRGRSIAGLNAYDGGLKRIRIRNVDLRRLWKFYRHGLSGLAPHRSRRKRDSRFRHIVDRLHVEHEPQKLAGTNSDFAAGGGNLPCAATLRRVGDNAPRQIQIDCQSASLYLHRL